MDLELNNINSKIIRELTILQKTFPYFSARNKEGDNLNLINVISIRSSIRENVIHKQWREKHDNRRYTT